MKPTYLVVIVEFRLEMNSKTADAHRPVGRLHRRARESGSMCICNDVCEGAGGSDQFVGQIRLPLHVRHHYKFIHTFDGRAVIRPRLQ